MKKITLSLLLTSFIYTVSVAQTFTLNSKSIGGQSTKKQEFNGFGCDGENISPQLSWKNAPAGTKSYAITVYDPDAPTGSGFWHWVVFDLPSTTKELVEGAGKVGSSFAPKLAVQSKTDFGGNGYGGPCPPQGHGIHQYIFTVHALKVDKLGLDENANPAIVGFNLWMNTIEKASLVMYYKR